MVPLTTISAHSYSCLQSKIGTIHVPSLLVSSLYGDRHKKYKEQKRESSYLYTLGKVRGEDIIRKRYTPKQEVTGAPSCAVNDFRTPTVSGHAVEDEEDGS